MARSKSTGGSGGDGGGLSPHIFELSRALNEFAASSRYNLLKTLQVGRFIDRKNRPLGIIEEFTFEKLIELGSKKLAKLRWLTPAQTETLIKLLQGLSEQQDTPPAPPPPANVVRLGGDPDDRAERVDDVVFYGSVEAENKLRETLALLRKDPRFSEVADLPLGHFWREHWSRSPFEEAMTIRQLAEVDLATILKKRTVTTKKIAMIVAALLSAKESLGGGPEDEVPPQARQSPTQIAPPLSPVTRQDAESPKSRPQSPWVRPIEGMPSSLSAAVWLFDAEIERIQSWGNHPMLAIAAGVRKTLVASEFVILLARAEATLPEALQASHISSIEAGLAKLESFVASPEGAPLDIWRAALASPGVSMARLRSAFAGSDLAEPVQEMVALLLLQGLKAHRTQLLDVPVTGFWTSRPQAIEVAVEHILGKLPLADAELDRTIAALLPDEMLEPIGTLLRARLDSVEGKWALGKK